MAGEPSQDEDFAAVTTKEKRGRDHFMAAVVSLIESEPHPEGLPPSPGFVNQLAELGYAWTTTALAPDLEAFRKHAKRKHIAPDDVLLAARKNPVTRAMLEREAERLKVNGKRKAP